MLYPIGKPVRLRLPLCDDSQKVIQISANREKSLVAVLTKRCLLVFQSELALLVASATREDSEYDNNGENLRMIWRHDSTAICVATNKCRLLVWRVECSSLSSSARPNLGHFGGSSSPPGGRRCYVPRESSDGRLKRATHELFGRDNIGATALVLAIVVRLTTNATCVVPLRDELLVCLRDGWMHRLRWTGEVIEEQSMHLGRVPFAHDQLHSKPEYVDSRRVWCRDAVYSVFVGGFSLVLSSGRAALLTSPPQQTQATASSPPADRPAGSPSFQSGQLLAVWAIGLEDARCTAANYKHRLVAYGCANGDIATYHLDESTGALVLAYRVGLENRDYSDSPTPTPSKNIPNESTSAADENQSENASSSNNDDGSNNARSPVSKSNRSVVSLQWDVHGSALAVGWAHGAKIALFSVYGAQLWSGSLGGSGGLVGIDWGVESYRLWTASTCERSLRLFSFVRDIALNNPAMGYSERVCLLSATGVHLSPSRGYSGGLRQNKAAAPHSVWLKLPVPHDYLANCSPLRYCALSDTVVAVAGSRGLAHCSLVPNNIGNTRKWRLFGNESQEREMIVTGGLILWNKGFVIAACFDTENETNDLRFYPLDTQLDNAHCTRYYADCQILILNLSGDYLATFDFESRVFIYHLQVQPRGSDGSAPSAVIVTRCAEVRTSDLVPHPACVVDLQLAALNHHTDTSQAEFAKGIDTVLLNVSGRLVMLCPRRLADGEPYQLQPPLLIASYVERAWTAHHNSDDVTPHLTEALYLHTGCRGTKVWLPLFPSQSASNAAAADHSGGTEALQLSSHRNFISKRIMLPFHLSIYPVAISSKDCLALGVESVETTSSAATQPYAMGVHRTSEVFLHHLLRQLLKRNLGRYALEIAGTCRTLPYFGHVLELLLHGVLEEEATSSEPIPDPLLPRVVAFIHEFPEFLRTIAHCARKTELALWRLLFATAGAPVDLFDACIAEHQLDTAASFLIILQNMDLVADSRRPACRLLEAALAEGKWAIARDVCRFVRAIHPAEFDSPQTSPMSRRKRADRGGGAAPLMLPLGSPTAKDEADTFVFTQYGVWRGQRHQSTSSAAASPTETEKGAAIKKHSATTRTSSDADTKSPLISYLNSTLTNHANALLTAYRLKDLGELSASVEFNLVLWLTSVRLSSALVNDFPLALTRLHADFDWPYPLLSRTVVDTLSRQLSSSQISQVGCQSPTTLLIAPLQVITRGASSSVLPSPGFDYGRNGAAFADGDTTSTSDEVGATVALSAARHLGSSASLQVEEEEPAWLPSPESDCSSDLDWEALEQLCGEAASRGSAESERQLRFLQNVMHETACVEWTLLVCLVLRDPSALAKSLTPKMVIGGDTLGRLRQAVNELDAWAELHCAGYKPLLYAAHRHMEALVYRLSVEDIDCLALPLEDVPNHKQNIAQSQSIDKEQRRRTASSCELNGSKEATHDDKYTAGANRPRMMSSSRHNTMPDIYVDVVSPVTPPGQDSSCALM